MSVAKVTAESELPTSFSFSTRLLDLLDQLHPLEKIEAARFFVQPDDDFHRHERAEMFFQPGIRLHDFRFVENKAIRLIDVLTFVSAVAGASMTSMNVAQIIF